MRCFLSKELRIRWAGLLALALLPGVVGCGGGGTGTVSGKVTYQDGPVKGGNVILASPKGKSVMAPINEDGTYTAKDVPVGDVKIAVQTKALGIRAAMAKNSKIPANSPMLASGMPPDEAARRFVAIPDQYEDSESSGLTFVVQKGPQEHNIPLTGKLGSGSGSKPKGSGSGPPK
jgi:hypothetical protein